MTQIKTILNKYTMCEDLGITDELLISISIVFLNLMALILFTELGVFALIFSWWCLNTITLATYHYYNKTNQKIRQNLETYVSHDHIIQRINNINTAKGYNPDGSRI